MTRFPCVLVLAVALCVSGLPAAHAILVLDTNSNLDESADFYVANMTDHDVSIHWTSGFHGAFPTAVPARAVRADTNMNLYDLKLNNGYVYFTLNDSAGTNFHFRAITETRACCPYRRWTYYNLAPGSGYWITSGQSAAGVHAFQDDGGTVTQMVSNNPAPARNFVVSLFVSTNYKKGTTDKIVLYMANEEAGYDPTSFITGSWPFSPD